MGDSTNWEYPAATDRGGTADDTDNFVILLAEMREAFDAVNPG
jgi:chitinase